MGSAATKSLRTTGLNRCEDVATVWSACVCHGEYGATFQIQLLAIFLSNT